MKLIAVCNNTPDTIYKMLEELEKTDITYIQYNSKIPSRIKTEYMFIFSFYDFRSGLKTLNSEAYKNKTVFLFCPIVSAKALSKIYFLDVAKTRKTEYSIKSMYKDLSLEILSAYLDKPYRVKKIIILDRAYAYTLIDHAKSGSLLNPLMTILYTVKAEGGLKVKEVVFKWLASKKGVEDLQKWLNEAYKFGMVTQGFAKSLLNLFNSDLGKMYKKAFIEILDQTEKSDIAKVAKKYDIDSYELRYIVNTLLKTKKHGNIGKNLH